MPIISHSIDNSANTALPIDDSASYYYILKDVQILGVYGVVGGESTDVHITNDGSIYGLMYGITFDGSENDTISNSASGTIDGDVGLDVVSGTRIGVYNAGVITGASAAISLEGDNGRINNIGSITSLGHAIVIGSGSDYRINNSGVISGDEIAYSGSSASDVAFRNTGSIVGDVMFGSGQNVFNGRGGTLNGTLFGGGNADTVYLGNDGEMVQGNGGHDQLYAGAGADTFAFTTTAAQSIDTVHDFDAARDKFRLAHTVFSALTADQAPVFATGTKAASAADHLFYNAATGGLFYDADGSGTKSANLLAHLDPGLNLTAHSFDVVAGSKILP